MATPHEQVRELLARLQAQLDELRALDPAVATRLAATLGDARTALDRSLGDEHLSAADVQPHRTLSEQLRDAAIRFEASHPLLARQLESLVDALGQMGI